MFHQFITALGNSEKLFEAAFEERLTRPRSTPKTYSPQTLNASSPLSDVGTKL